MTDIDLPKHKLEDNNNQLSGLEGTTKAGPEEEEKKGYPPAWKMTWTRTFWNSIRKVPSILVIVTIVGFLYKGTILISELSVSQNEIKGLIISVNNNLSNIQSNIFDVGKRIEKNGDVLVSIKTDINESKYEIKALKMEVENLDKK